jgi:DNA polymerase-3 subunit gamma/tau
LGPADTPPDRSARAWAIDDEDPDRERLLDLSSRLSPEFVQLAYQIVIHGRAELPLAPDEYAGFMMTLLRLHGFGRSQLPMSFLRLRRCVRPSAGRQPVPCRCRLSKA